MAISAVLGWPLASFSKGHCGMLKGEQHLIRCSGWTPLPFISQFIRSLESLWAVLISRSKLRRGYFSIDKVLWGQGERDKRFLCLVLMIQFRFVTPTHSWRLMFKSTIKEQHTYTVKWCFSEGKKNPHLVPKVAIIWQHTSSFKVLLSWRDLI